VYASADKATRVPYIEIARHDQIIAEDRRRSGLMLQSRQAAAPNAGAPQSAQAAISSPSRGDNDDSSLISNGADSSYYDTGSPASHDSAESFKDFVDNFMALTQTNRPHDTMTTVELSYNIKVVKKLEDPKHYFEEQRVLVK
jgi:hypothetical protein